MNNEALHKAEIARELAAENKRMIAGEAYDRLQISLGNSNHDLPPPKEGRRTAH